MTANDDKFLPEVTPLHQPFWDSVREHNLRLQRCNACGAFRFIPTEICTCGSMDSTWTAIAGTGTVYTYTVIHRAPTPAYQADVPYVIAHVTIPEGPRLIANLVGCAPEAVHIDMPVRITYHDVTPDVSLFHFTPESSGRV